MGRSLPTSERLASLGRELHRLVRRCAEPARTAREVEARVSEGERIAAAIRAAFRGGAGV